MRKLIYCVAMTAALLAATPAWAHFIWVAVENDKDGRPTAHIWFSEQAEPDDEALIDKVMHAKAWLHEADQPAKILELKKVVADGGGSLACQIGAKAPYGVTASCKYGVIERGGKVFLLNYYAKYLEANSASLSSLARAKSLDLDIVPRAAAEGYELEVLWQGKPAAECEVTVITPDAKQEKLATDKTGKVRLAAKLAGLYSIRAKLAQDASGEEGGQKYKQIVHYSTLALRVPASALKDSQPAAK